VKERAPCFQFFPRQFTGDDQVTGMDLDAIGAHILLMCYAAASPERYRIPCRSDAETHSIRMRLRNPSDESWEIIKTQLLAGAWKISADGQFWEQDGLKRTFMKQKEFSERQAQRANARWCRTDAESMPDACRKHAGGDAGEDAEPMPEVCSSSSSSNPSSELEICSDQVGSPPRKKTAKEPSQEASRLVALFKAEILRNKADFRITQAQERKWATTAQRMLDLDKRDAQEIADLIRWVQHDEFWMANVLSMDTLREKFDQLQLKRGHSNGNGKAKIQPLAGSDISRLQKLGMEHGEIIRLHGAGVGVQEIIRRQLERNGTSEHRN
jgi:hypothetical protein